MTREEKALIYFKDLRARKFKDYSSVFDTAPKDSVVYEAVSAEIEIYDTTIKALEREVSQEEDNAYREKIWGDKKMTNQEAIKELEYVKKQTGYADIALDMAIKALETQPCEDCISRQAVKDMLMKTWTKYVPIELDVNLSFVMEKISELPSVTPTITDVENDFNLGYNCGYADAMIDIAEGSESE